MPDSHNQKRYLVSDTALGIEKLPFLAQNKRTMSTTAEMRSGSHEMSCRHTFGALLVASGFLLAIGQTQGNARQLTGPEIFSKQCARCHGRKGEGVRGKFDGPLQGDRTLENLICYIDKKMPEDDPSKCVGKDAELVAKYIYGAFYSQEARLRTSKPPRIELVHLTNRQYLNSIADLLGEFTSKNNPEGEPGLRATYYTSKDFAGDKKAIERVDQTVDFDYADGFPDEKLKGTNGFSMQWLGSLKAEETGNHEIILKTPNGARLWLNDEVEPLIDAWVASGKVSEHKATVRLLAGRHYPLKLQFFKSKEKLASVSLQWSPPHGAQQPIPARHLSTSRAAPVLVLNTVFPPDDSSYGYERGLSVSKAWDEATTAAAIEVANYVVTNLDRLSGSKADETNRSANIEKFCMEFVTRAFRKPLTEQQQRLYVSSQLQSSGSSRKRQASPGAGAKTREVHSALAGRTLATHSASVTNTTTLHSKEHQSRVEQEVKRLVLLTLKSPRFLYLGLSDARPDDFDVASRLSYCLWDSVPDEALRRAAAQHVLHTSEQVLQSARRMLEDPRAHAKMQQFFHHWLQMDRIESLAKDDKAYPGFTPAIIGDLRASLDIFLEETMWNSASDYRTLLRADYVYMNNRLAEFYGVTANTTDEFIKVTLQQDPRSGVLTHPYLLSAFAYQKLSSPIHRGVFLTRNIVGRSLKPPPMAMTFKDADFAPNMTMRQKVSELTRSQNCQTCHSVINPLGFSLEQFDAVGRFRTKENENPIDPVSDYLTDEGQTVHLTGARDIAEYAIGSEQAHKAFIQQLFNHVVKEPMLAYGLDTMKRLHESFIASDFNMQKLLVDIATISALHGVERNSIVSAR